MKPAYLIVGGAMILAGGGAAIDLLTHSGFSRIETPRLGPWGVLGPAVLLIGLVFVRFQGRPFSRRAVGALVIVGGLVQTLGLVPFVQPRILAPTAGHAGVGLNEIVSGLLMLAGMVAFPVTTVLVLVDRPA